MFRRATVIDIISHPGLINDDFIRKLTAQSGPLRLSYAKKAEFLRTLPVNSIIGSFVDNKNIFVALPFFSSHMSLPLKQQEEVWIYEDLSASKDIENEYYWVSRIHGTNFYEDANYTHSDRKYLRNYEVNNLKNPINNVSIALFNNGPIRFNSDGKSGDNFLGRLEKRITDSFNLSFKHRLEDVPRSFKNPGDYIIQGSNNTLIRLGTNHIRKSNNDLKEIYLNTIFDKEPETYSGTIDLVAGRAVTSQELSVQKANVNYIKDSKVLFNKNITKNANKNSQFIMYNEFGISENLKDNNFYLGNSQINWAEGDPDLATDVSRVLISEYINGDSLLNYSAIKSISQDGNSQNLSNTKKRGFIIAKSDEIRLVARENILAKSHSNNNQIENSNQFLGSGSIRLIKEGSSLNRGYIVINEDGNISIDGPAIVLGDKSREKDNGKGDNIYLGNNAVEPGVLGYMLKNKLENFMDETIRALNIIGLCLKDLDTHVHSYAGPAGQTLQPMKGTVFSTGLETLSENGNFSLYPLSDASATERSGSPGDIDGNYGKIGSISAPSKKLEDKIKGISEIRESLSEILSKMVKTL